jgi:pSer/pThr/pTyr-binding forkhead associated (FHA) protein
MSEKLRLKVTTGAAAGRELLVADELVLGREAPGDGNIADDVEMSRQHARITRTNQDEWGIEDLGSRNGTFVNGHQIEKRELLGAGDSIELGGTRLVVQVSAPGTAPAAPEPAEPEPVLEPTQEEEPAPVPEPKPLGDTLVGDVVSGDAPEPEGMPEPAPEATPAPEPEIAEPAEPPAPAVAPLSLTVDLDPAAGEAVISLGPGSDSIRLVFDDGAWRLQPGA